MADALCTTKTHKTDGHSTLTIRLYLCTQVLEPVASFRGLPRSFCSSVCVDNNAWMRNSGEEWGRPGIIHHMSDVRWTRGGHGGAGAIVVSEAVHHPVGSVRTLHG